MKTLERLGRSSSTEADVGSPMRITKDDCWEKFIIFDIKNKSLLNPENFTGYEIRFEDNTGGPAYEAFRMGSNVQVTMALLPNLLDLVKPCEASLLKLKHCGFLRDTKLRENDSVANLRVIAEVVWGMVLKDTKYRFYRGSSPHEMMVPIQEDSIIGDTGLYDMVFVVPYRTLANSQAYKMPCETCFHAQNDRGGNEGQMREHRHERGNQEPSAARRNAERFEDDDQSYNPIDVPNMLENTQRFLSEERTEVDFWIQYHESVFGKKPSWQVFINRDRRIVIQSYAFVMKYHGFRSNLQVTFADDQVVLEDADTCRREGWTYVSARMQSEDLLEGQYQLLTGPEGRRRFAKAIGIEMTLFRYAMVFILKGFVHGGEGFFGLHPAIAAFLVDEDWQKHLADFTTEDTCNDAVKNMLTQISGPYAEIYFVTNFQRDFKDCYGEPCRVARVNEAISELAMKELIADTMDQMTMLKDAIANLGLKDAMKKFPESRRRFFPAKMYPTVGAVKAMFDFPENVIANTLRSIGEDRKRLRDVVMSVNSTFNLLPKSIKVQIPVFVATNVPPICVHRLTKTIRLNPGCNASQLEQALLQVFKNAGSQAEVTADQK